jgi:NitT/TauT family transport system substrate-binding protein
VPIDRVITNKFIDDINSYDRAGIISEAKKEDLSKID